MATFQPSARPCSATGSLVRAAVCIACGLWSLSSPALAQAPATTADLPTKAIQPWQGGQPAESRQPRLLAFDKAISDNSVLAKGNLNVGREMPRNVEEQVLLPLLLEEKRLLEYYGAEHPDVLSIRERIQIVREYLTQQPPLPPPAILAPPPPIPVQTSYREVPSTRASTSRSAGQTLVPLPPVSSQIRESVGAEGDTQTVASRSQPKLIRPAGFSTAGNPIRDSGTASASLAAPPPTVVKTNDKDTHPAASVSPKPSAQDTVSPPSGGRDNSAGQPPEAQPRENSFFETGFGQLIGILYALFLGGLIQVIALVLILRRRGAQTAQVFRVELVNPPTVNFVGQVSAAGMQTVAASPAPNEIPPSSTAEEMMPSSSAAEESSTAETFDIGPTYEEEMQQKQEALRQQEEAVLRQIFEENVQIREQLSQLTGGAE